MKLQPAAIVAAGAVCAIGGCVEQIVAAVRTGISGTMSSSVYDRFFDAVKLALVPTGELAGLVPGVEALSLTARQRRMLRLATPALQQALPQSGLEHVPLFLGVPDAHPKRPAPVDATFLRCLEMQLELRFDARASRVFPNGRASGLLALEAGLQHLTERRADRVLVGAVDSYLDLGLLGELDAEQRLLGQHAPDGFVPGEGAAFVVLDAMNKSGRSPEAAVCVSSAGAARDAGHRYADEPAKGEGLAAALDVMLDALNAPPSRVQTTFAGLNGESLGAKAWGVARARHAALFGEAMELWHPADCFGDAGAATGVLLLALAADMLAREQTLGPALVWAASDGADCACALVDRLV